MPAFNPPESLAFRVGRLLAQDGKLRGVISGLHVATGESDLLTDVDAEKISADTTPFDHDAAADLPILTDSGQHLMKVLVLQEAPWDDQVRILLNDGPVNEKSPGQRSSAMLPLIALAERSPLIIDQPEDNLDKRLIGNVLVRVLAELKEKRQIIVCTHDPNILVGGDSEQVIVLDAETDRKAEVVDHGSIDRAAIVQTVIDLLEGGAEAFETRRRRYDLPKQDTSAAGPNAVTSRPPQQSQ